MIIINKTHNLRVEIANPSPVREEGPMNEKLRKEKSKYYIKFKKKMMRELV